MSDDTYETIDDAFMATEAPLRYLASAMPRAELEASLKLALDDVYEADDGN